MALISSATHLGSGSFEDLAGSLGMTLITELSSAALSDGGFRDLSLNFAFQ